MNSKDNLTPSAMIKEDDSDVVVNLMQFLSANNWQNEGKLQVANFPETGRGIRTANGTDLWPDDTLIDMPFKSIFISLITLVEDKGFKRDCLDKLNGTVSIQLLLSVYLAYHRELGGNSKWKPFLDSLPTSLTTPHFCNEPELDCVPMVKYLVRKSIQEIMDAFTSSFSSCTLNGKKFTDLFAQQELLLMFFLVNSRCVYCDPRVIRNNCKSNVAFLSDEPNMALAPFLDLINHSDTVETESNLYLDKKSAELRYELVTKSAMSGSRQLFISYGNHDNFKLLMEYGFIIDGNRHEKIDLSSDQIENFMRSHPKFYHAKKMAFIKSQEMHLEVFISEEGPSYNLESIFKIFKSAALNEKSLSEVVYQETTIPIDDSVDLERDLYSYLINRFERAKVALEGIEQLSASGALLKEFFAVRVRFLSKLRDTN